MKAKAKSKKKGTFKLSYILEFILYAVLYTGVFLLVDKMFGSFKINGQPKILYALLAVVIIDILSKVVKPLLVTFFTPITGLTFGLFYFVIQSFILWLTDLIMFDLLNFTNIWLLFPISIVLIIFNFIVRKLIIEPIVKKAS